MCILEKLFNTGSEIPGFQRSSQGAPSSGSAWVDSVKRGGNPVRQTNNGWLPPVQSPREGSPRSLRSEQAWSSLPAIRPVTRPSSNPQQSMRSTWADQLMSNTYPGSYMPDTGTTPLAEYSRRHAEHLDADLILAAEDESLLLQSQMTRTQLMQTQAALERAAQEARRREQDLMQLKRQCAQLSQQAVLVAQRREEVARKRQELELAALRIQAAQRSRAARAELERRRAAHEEREDAASVLQNAQRSRSSRQELRRRRQQRDEQDSAATVLQNTHRSRVSRKELRRRRHNRRLFLSEREDAAVCLQNAQRSRIARGELRRRRHTWQNREESATRLQNAQRSKTARGEVQRRRTERDERHAAAIRLQNAQRSKAARADVAKKIAMRDERESAAKTLQNAQRSRMARADLEQRRAEHKAREDAATVLQNVQRARVARSEVGYRRAEANISPATKKKLAEFDALSKRFEALNSENERLKGLAESEIDVDFDFAIDDLATGDQGAIPVATSELDTVAADICEEDVAAKYDRLLHAHRALKVWAKDAKMRLRKQNDEIELLKVTVAQLQSRSADPDVAVTSISANKTKIEAFSKVNQEKITRAQSNALFEKLDKIKDGKLNYMEIKKGLKKMEVELGMKLPISARRFWRRADTNCNKTLNPDEFFRTLCQSLTLDST